MSARELAEETAGRIMMRMPVAFKSDLRQEITRQLFPLCLKMAEVSEGITEMQRVLSIMDDRWGFDVPDYVPSSWTR